MKKLGYQLQYYLRKDDHDKAIENLNTALNIISKNY